MRQHPAADVLRRTRPLASTPHIELLVLQPTPFCNLDCSYCYLPRRDDRRRMSDATLEQTFTRVFDSPFLGDHLTVVWHAGEPLVMPREFYARAFGIAEHLRPKELTITHSIQTNATLLDEAWATFLRQHRVHVGVSLDGPPHLHNARRRTRAGRGTFDQALRGVRALQDAGIPFHVITVLTADSLLDPDGLYDFFVANGITHVGFNFDEQEGANSSSSMNFPGVSESYRRFLRRFLERIHSAPPGTLAVREFDGAFAEIVSSPSQGCDNPQVEAFRILCVDADGNVSTFSPELLGMRNERYADFLIGNVFNESLHAMALGARAQKLAHDIRAGVQACGRECAYFRFCGGGAPANKLFETGRFDSTETLYCRLMKKAVLDTVLGDVEESLGIARPREAMASD